ncbi:hypothetical protein C4K68_13155 [Pokkaliibacter plantistimulans]|uniref:Uncharacterized protein n=1 Tax=Proteobacteria bacterium 228 TaxID=2083153 RepID=A0A2S5KQ62_9PROT|nr:hypothetical protein [Pokkaliibacter plantistimulans]PPC76880.1 hypothetical protein C4K68_13155 [Pokkaliibacter plantistimulans]
MQRWTAPIHNQNHRKLMGFHILLGMLYFITNGICLLLVGPDASPYLPAMALTSFCLFLLHGLLAFGCGYRFEAARKASEVLGAFMMIGFPIGTLLGYFLLQRTYWLAPRP